VDIALIADVRTNLFHEGNDDGKYDGVEEKVGDGDPVLQLGPVVGKHHPHVLRACYGCSYHPADHETLASFVGPCDEEEGAGYPKESIKDCVLDEGSDADILSLAFRAIGIESSSIFDHIQYGCQHCYQELYNPYHYHRPLQGKSTDSIETGLTHSWTGSSVT